MSMERRGKSVRSVPWFFECRPVCRDVERCKARNSLHTPHIERSRNNDRGRICRKYGYTSCLFEIPGLGLLVFIFIPRLKRLGIQHQHVRSASALTSFLVAFFPFAFDIPTRNARTSKSGFHFPHRPRLPACLLTCLPASRKTEKGKFGVK